MSFWLPVYLVLVAGAGDAIPDLTGSLVTCGIYVLQLNLISKRSYLVDLFGLLL